MVMTGPKAAPIVNEVWNWLNSTTFGEDRAQAERWIWRLRTALAKNRFDGEIREALGFLNTILGNVAEAREHALAAYGLRAGAGAGYKANLTSLLRNVSETDKATEVARELLSMKEFAHEQSATNICALTALISGDHDLLAMCARREEEQQVEDPRCSNTITLLRGREEAFTYHQQVVLRVLRDHICKFEAWLTMEESPYVLLLQYWVNVPVRDRFRLHEKIADALWDGPSQLREAYPWSLSFFGLPQPEALPASA